VLLGRFVEPEHPLGWGLTGQPLNLNLQAASLLLGRNFHLRELNDFLIVAAHLKNSVSSSSAGGAHGCSR
jgi:hypothetical protein